MGALARPGRLSAYHPDAARKAFLNGRAVLLCHVAADGALNGCRAEDVSPGDLGFAEAALRMQRLFKLPPPAPAGEQVDSGWVRVPLTFKLVPDLEASVLPVKHPQVTGIKVYLDCRYQGTSLDDCTAEPATDQVKAVALAFAASVKVPTPPRPRGRLMLPLAFAGDPRRRPTNR